jgi:hypothetical protein
MGDETQEQYNGWKNRETWAFNLHWANDEGLYMMVLDWAREITRAEDEDDKVSDYELGEQIIKRMRDLIDNHEEEYGSPLPKGLRMYRDEVGSWWRIDETETGASVRESLS